MAQSRTQRSATLASASATASGASVAVPSPSGAAACATTPAFVIDQCALHVRRAEVQALNNSFRRSASMGFLPLPQRVDGFLEGAGLSRLALPRARRLSARLASLLRQRCAWRSSSSPAVRCPSLALRDVTPRLPFLSLVSYLR